MNNSMNSRKNAARAERLQRRLDAGTVATHYPEVASIVINMMYSQKGLRTSLPRIVNFFPSSSALFRVDCLNKDCLDGGFDFTQVITGMIRNHGKVAKGNLSCEGECVSADHAAIAYEVVVQYT